MRITFTYVGHETVLQSLWCPLFVFRRAPETHRARGQVVQFWAGYTCIDPGLLKTTSFEANVAHHSYSGVARFLRP